MEERIRAALAATPLLSGLGEAEMRELAAVCSLRTLKRRETLFIEGDPAEAFFLVLSGQVKVYKVSADGKEHVLHLAGAGQTFAEGAVFGFKGFPASAEAVGKAEVIAVPKEQFLAVLDHNPLLCRSMFRELAVWLRRLTDIIFALAFSDVETRLVSYLVMQCHEEHDGLEDGMEFDLGIEKALLASYLGTIPETFSRALRKLQDNGLISVEGPRVTVRDAKAMREMIAKE